MSFFCPLVCLVRGDAKEAENETWNVRSRGFCWSEMRRIIKFEDDAGQRVQETGVSSVGDLRWKDCVKHPRKLAGEGDSMKLKPLECTSEYLVPYTMIDEIDGWEGENFTSTTDDTDHFGFSCGCGEEARVMELLVNGEYSGIVAVFFYLQCPSCGKTGYRKINLPKEVSP